MYACVCSVILLYEFGLLVCFDVILVTIVIFTTFLRSSGIDILMGFLVHLALLFLLGVPFFWSPKVFTIACLDLPVFLLGVSLLWSLNKGCVNYLAFIE